ncbi:MAG TPA: (2Fe-2S) ferredoxin domain-containing protein [Phototrophicaceae bacterium]|jgi:(2Fe-2S) ferredoxin|nr:(2Fe-2S) ferredoxin domain-containing protein [Phototrophicaceae bacterium]
MPENSTTSTSPLRRRVVVCRGQFCNESRRADRNLSILQPLIDELNAGQYPPPIKLETANCLSMCGAGPNLIIYEKSEEIIVVHHIKQTDIELIVNTHLRGNSTTISET